MKDIWNSSEIQSEIPSVKRMQNYEAYLDHFWTGVNFIFSPQFPKLRLFSFYHEKSSINPNKSFSFFVFLFPFSFSFFFLFLFQDFKRKQSKKSLSCWSRNQSLAQMIFNNSQVMCGLDLLPVSEREVSKLYLFPEIDESMILVVFCFLLVFFFFIMILYDFLFCFVFKWSSFTRKPFERKPSKSLFNKLGNDVFKELGDFDWITSDK